MELARRPDNSYDSNCAFVSLIPRPLLPRKLWPGAYSLFAHAQNISKIFMGFVKQHLPYVYIQCIYLFKVVVHEVITVRNF